MIVQRLTRHPLRPTQGLPSRRKPFGPPPTLRGSRFVCDIRRQFHTQAQRFDDTNTNHSAVLFHLLGLPRDRRDAMNNAPIPRRRIRILM
jgi:hypothetical protein